MFELTDNQARILKKLSLEPVEVNMKESLLRILKNMKKTQKNAKMLVSLKTLGKNAK